MFAVRNLFVVVMVCVAGTSPLFAQAKGKGPQRLAGTEWHGTESLAGYGKLVFKFSETKVVMIDAKETSEGTYKAERDKIVLTFAGGNVMYTGKLMGTTLSGEAIDTNFKPWKWSVTLKSAAADTPKADPVVEKMPVVEKGPIVVKGPTVEKGPAAGPKIVVPEGKMTPERLPEFLKKMGYKVETVPTEIGAPYCLITVEKDGWNFVLEVTITKEGDAWLTAPLVEVNKDKISSAKILQILESNLNAAPCFFCYRAADKHLVMKLEVIRMDEDSFRADVNLITERIRMTHTLWSDEK